MHFSRLAMSFLAVAAVALAGCGDDAADDTTTTTDSTAVAPGEVRIVKGEHGPAFNDARLTVVSPGPDEVVTADSVMVRVSLTGVELTAPTPGEQSKGINFSPDGQHIHVIIDDKPYMAMYKQDSFSVGALAPGAHTLRAFPSRSWHESIKVPGAFVAHTFYVKEKSGEPAMAMNGPLLTYSRPKGDYKGDDAKRILLDFYIANAELGPDKYKVVASIDGQVRDTLTEWVPYFIEGLGDGEHTVALQLIGPDGQPVPGAYNSSQKTIRVNPSETSTATQAPAQDSGAAGQDTGMKGMGH